MNQLKTPPYIVAENSTTRSNNMSYTKARNIMIKEICAREGKKSSVSVGNVREIVKIISELQCEAYLEKRLNGPCMVLTVIAYDKAEAISKKLRAKKMKFKAKKKASKK